jgi:hypothetical protein
MTPLALIRHTLDRVADEVGGEIGADIRAMDERRLLGEAERDEHMPPRVGVGQEGIE